MAANLSKRKISVRIVENIKIISHKNEDDETCRTAVGTFIDFLHTEA